MSYCEHCEGQRFDRARVLRALRQVQKDIRRIDAGGAADRAVAVALKTVSELDLPHLELEDDEENGVVH